MKREKCELTTFLENNKMTNEDEKILKGIKLNERMKRESSRQINKSVKKVQIVFLWINTQGWMGRFKSRSEITYSGSTVGGTRWGI